jgi:transcriptional regulator with XRE-family HTH domain
MDRPQPNCSVRHYDALHINIDVLYFLYEVWRIAFLVITSAQLRAARALLGLDQRELAQHCALSLPTIQRMEASDGVIRGNVDSLMKLVNALDAAGIELIGDNATSSRGGRGVRFKEPPENASAKELR